MNTLSGNGLTIGQSLRPNYQMQIAGAPYSLNPQRILLPNGRTEYAPLNLRSNEQKERQHMLIYGGDKEFPLAMGREIPPGKGGSPGQPYQPPQPTGPYVPPPNHDMMIRV